VYAVGGFFSLRGSSHSLREKQPSTYKYIYIDI